MYNGMKASLAILALLIAAVAIAPVGTTMARPTDPFVGAWTATDNVDGSNLKMAITGGGSGHRFNLFDDAGFVCGVFFGDSTVPAVYRGTGTHPVPDLGLETLVLDGPVWCLLRGAGGRTLVPGSPFVTTLDYNPITDTLTGAGDTWNRAGA